MDTTEGCYRIVATPMRSPTPPDPETPWQARADVYRFKEDTPLVTLVPIEWFPTPENAEVVALTEGITAAKLLSGGLPALMK